MSCWRCCCRADAQPANATTEKTINMISDRHTRVPAELLLVNIQAPSRLTVAISNWPSVHLQLPSQRKGTRIPFSLLVMWSPGRRGLHGRVMF
jgi:hypothetical protein